MKIPEYNNDILPAGGDVRSVRDSTQVEDAFGRTLSAAAQISGQYFAKQQKTKQVADLTRAQSTILGIVTAKEAEIRQDVDDHPNWSKRFGEIAKEEIEQSLADIDDEEVRAAALDDATRMIGKTQAQLMEAGVTVGKDRARAAAYTAMEEMQGIAINSPNRIKEIERNVDATLAGLAADGSISEESRAKAKTLWGRQVWGAVAEMDILKNPYGALEKLESNAYGIDPSDKPKYMKAAMARAEQLTNQRKEVDKLQAGLNFVEAAVETGTPLDYANTDHKNAVDAYYKTKLIPKLANAKDKPAALADFIGRIGMIPKTLQSTIRSQLLAGDESAVVRVADLIDRIDNVNPAILQDTVGQKDIAFAKVVNQRINAGVEPRAAVEEAKKLRDMPQEVEKSLRAQYKKEKLASKNDNYLENADFVDKWYSSAATVPRPMQAEFDRLVEDNYTLTGGDIDTARKMTANAMKRKWAITTIGGEKRMMRFAPEAVYKPIDSDTDWIKEQFESVTDGLPDPSIESDFKTERDAMPSYLVTVGGIPYFTEKDVKPPLYKDGLSVRYRPNYEMTGRFTERKKAIEMYQQEAKRKYNQTKTMQDLLQLPKDLAGAVEQFNTDG